MHPALTEETVLSVIRSRGVFQINPLAYRNAKRMKVLKAMVRKGTVARQRVSPSVHNYLLPET